MKYYSERVVVVVVVVTSFVWRKGKPLGLEDDREVGMAVVMAVM